MTEPDLKRVETLFHGAADLDEQERRSFLDRECGDDAGLRARVEDLLLEAAGDSLGLPEIGLTTGAPLSEAEGTVIGSYKLLQQIGEGGFGVVYMAEQTAPVVRKVALKIIKLGMDTREVVARFEAERQALAMMEHPNIAKVLAGGATDTGRPYFVMELVRGVPITEYCDTAKLPTRERLELFIQVCHAVQHAHQKGIIHRDIKPSNVLVTLHDGRPVPKVIDFGIAKATNARLTEKTLFTRFQHFIGTPVYMSPEQAEMSGLDIDTRTDIYSLGVLLYELLVGAPPFDPKTFARAAYGEIQRIIREQEPPKPSTRLTTSCDDAVAARRGSDPQSLSRRVRGDLDWIVMKALEKDRTRRYGTASDFAADVERHLRQEPVDAGPPSAAYRTRKFLARNRAAVAWVSVVVLALLAGFVATTLALVEASEQRDLAVESARDTDDVTRYLLDVLGLTDFQTARNPNLSVKTLLDRAVEGIEETFAGKPRAEARVRTTIGKAYASLGAYVPSETQLLRAEELLAQDPEVDQHERLRTMWVLTDVSFKLERPTAYAVARRTLGLATGLARARDADLGNHLAEMYEAALRRDIDRTEAAFDRAVRRSRAQLDDDDVTWPVVAYVYQACCMAMWYSPVESRTAPMYEEALRIRRRALDPADPLIAETLNLLVGVLNRDGRPKDSEARIRDALARMRQTYPDDHQSVGFARGMLGENLTAQGRYEQAESELQASHDVIWDTWGEINFFTADACARLIRLYDAWDKPEKAAPLREKLAQGSAFYHYTMGWQLAQLTFPPAEVGIHSAMGKLVKRIADNPYGCALLTDDPEGLLVDAVAVAKLSSALGEDLRRVTLGRYLVASASIADAPLSADAIRTVATEAVAALELVKERLPLEYAEARIRLASVTDDADLAGKWVREALDLIRIAPQQDSWVSAGSKARAARWLIRLGRHEQAETLLLAAHQALLISMGAIHEDTGAVVDLLIDLYTAWNRPADAARWRKRLSPR